MCYYPDRIMRNVTTLLALAWSALIPSLLVAGSTGKIAGTVTDAVTKDVLIGVSVRVDGTPLGASSDLEGHYTILNVPPGTHTVIASYVGYKKVEVKNVGVSVDFTTTLNFTLEQGDIQVDAVVVEGERTPLIRQDLTNPVASISSEAIEALPVTSIDEVVGLQAGVTVDDNGTLHVRGGEGNEVLYTVNGININNPYGNSRSVGLATNAVQEVSVSTGTFNAEYGSALSGVVNYVTKEGGRSWTGSLRHLTGDNYSSHDGLFVNIDDLNLSNTSRTEASLGGPLLGDWLTFYGSGVYNWGGGYLYGERRYLPTDSYVFRTTFPGTDPRRTGSSSDPLYFAPFRHDTSDNTGLPYGNGVFVPLNWSRSYNLQGNLTLRIAPTMRLKYELVYDNTSSPENNGNSTVLQSRYKPDGRSINNGNTYFHSIDWTHSVNEKMFYTIKGSYIRDIETRRAYDDINDPRYLPSFYLQFLPTTSFLTGGVDLERFYRKSEVYAGKADLVAQILGNHEVKTGVEIRSHKIFIEDYTLFFGDPALPTKSFSVTDALAGAVLKPFIPGEDQGYVAYTRKPLQMAAYLQDKIEVSKSIILNLGLRYEYFDPAAKYNPFIGDELATRDTTVLYKNLTDASVKHMFSPRFSVSYPITDRGTIRFSYGHFYQIGNLSSLYRNSTFRALQGTTPVFGNADVNPQKSIQYELGMQQGVTDDIKVEVTGYYKDVSNYIFLQTIQTDRGDQDYQVLTNLNYANTRGISVSLVKRRSPGSLLSATVDYTFQIAEGNRTEPSEDIFFNEQRGQLSETYLVPFSFDRSHTITATVALTQPDDWTVSCIGYFRTGTPYTPALPSNLSPVEYTQNSSRQPIQWNVDLRLEKFFNVYGLDFSIFCLVDNLFDVENELSVYANSGRALYNSEQANNPFQFEDLRRRISRGDPGLIPASVIDDYYARPQNISQPRLVRFGASVIF